MSQPAKRGAFLILYAAVIVSGACLLYGCDPITRYKVASTIFDGVPSLPPPEKMCAEYADKRLTEFQDELAGKKKAVVAVVLEDSRHQPYAEKQCDSCHDKNKEGGTVLPKNELCFLCHKNFFKGAFLHGPAAVGDCLACHLPHNSAYAPLLKVSKKEICGTCHREKRLASGMHDKVSAQGLVCVDCHDPHSGNAQYFLK